MSDPTLYLASRQQGPDQIDPYRSPHPSSSADIRVGRTAAITIIALAAITAVACACVIVFQ